MDISQVQGSEIQHLDLLTKQVVEGFITGMHKSPFHGFSVEFSEHKLYNAGESTRHIDWKLYAKTEKLYTKKYEEETNLRCHIILDNSASMHYPMLKKQSLTSLNKIGFSVVAAASLLEILKRQRDAVGLSIYADTYQYYAPEKGSERHRKMLLHQLEQVLANGSNATTDTYQYLHEIAEKMHRRSLLFLFTDLFQTTKKEEELFEALRHLKYNKHEVVLFHTYDSKTELQFQFDDDSPKKFVDVETGQELNIYAENIQKAYNQLATNYFKEIKTKCLQYKIDYVPVDINKGFTEVLTAYLLQRKNFK